MNVMAASCHGSFKTEQHRKGVICQSGKECSPTGGAKKNIMIEGTTNCAKSFMLKHLKEILIVSQTSSKTSQDVVTTTWLHRKMFCQTYSR